VATHSCARAATRYLEAAYESSPFPALWAGTVARVLKDRALDRIVDIGSGSGGPIKTGDGSIGKAGLLTIRDVDGSISGRSGFAAQLLVQVG